MIDRPIGVHPQQREKMAIRRDDRPAARPRASTRCGAFRRFRGRGILPKTGRTHQIRVHLATSAARCCATGNTAAAPDHRGEIRRDPADELVLLERQALHARRLRFVHPAHGEPLEFEAPLPADMQGVLDDLRKYRKIDAP